MPNTKRDLEFMQSKLIRNAIETIGEIEMDTKEYIRAAVIFFVFAAAAFTLL